MADLSRGTRSRRAARRPGWMLLTVLLVLAIGASSALVFTDKVQLLKLAVILALWAAVVAAFVSVIYRRQSDLDQAKARDLKLVYDLQLDREISARREYELTVETQLRRELTSEIRAQAADEVAGLRAELAALRTNLEILFDADLSHRPAIETDRSRSYGAEWPHGTETAGRVMASRIDTEDSEDLDANTEESPIIDVPAEPSLSENGWPPTVGGGAHRRPSEAAQDRAYAPPPPPPEPVVQQEQDWRPAPAEGQWIPAGSPGSNWVAPNPAEDIGFGGEYVGRRRAPEPAMQTAPGRHSAPSATTDPSSPIRHGEPAPAQQPEGRRHRSVEDTGGQSVADLIARLQAAPTRSGRRRRRDE